MLAIVGAIDTGYKKFVMIFVWFAICIDGKPIRVRLVKRFIRFARIYAAKNRQTILMGGATQIPKKIMIPEKCRPAMKRYFAWIISDYTACV